MHSFIPKFIYPKGILGRFLLMLLAPMAITQIVAVYTFYNRHWDSVSRHMLRGITGEIQTLAYIAMSIDGSPESTERFSYIRNSLYLDASVQSGAPDTTQSEYVYGGSVRHEDQRSERIFDLTKKLQDRLPYPVKVFRDGDEFSILVLLPNNITLTVRVSSKRLENPSTYIFILWMLGAGLLSGCIAALFMRNQLRAVTQLADVMRDYGSGIKRHAVYKPFGAREVRQAGESFIRMRRRIDRFVRNRTEMLTGISHDLKTPITRIKLQLALLPENEDHRAINTDLDEMHSMIDMYLSYLREEEHSKDTPRQADIADCISLTLAKYPSTDMQIKYLPYQGVPLRANTTEMNMRRVLENCLQNAERYGNGVARIRLFATKRHAVLCIEDNGKGVRGDVQDTIFLPFVRDSRKRRGSGIGLSVVSDIVKKAGGTVKMERSEELGGARCKIRFPILH